MAPIAVERRKSLIHNEYDNAISVDSPAKISSKLMDMKKKPAVKGASTLSIDDLDMVSLGTNFDKQMEVGSPMYWDPDGEASIRTKCGGDYQAQTKDHISYHSTPVNGLYGSSSGDDAEHNPFNQIIASRTKYVVNSFQNSASNIKYHDKKAFIYPKPLPKFWKFENDKRLTLQDEEEKKNYYVSASNEFDDDEDLVNLPEKLPQSSNKPAKLLGGVHHTGELFDFELYKKALKKHQNKIDEDNASDPSHKFCDFNFFQAIPSYEEFREDFQFVVDLLQNKHFNDLAKKRISYLGDKFELYQHLRAKSEILENKKVPHRDFYNSRKVDGNLILSGCVSQRQLSEFIWQKLNTEPDRVVYIISDNTPIKLSEVFGIGCNVGEPAALGLKIIDDDFLEWYKSVYLLNYHLIPTQNVDHQLIGKELRFYLLAKIFLEFDNILDGEYFAEIFIKYAIHTWEKSKYQLAQVSVDFQFYDKGEVSWWTRFSNWIRRWNLISYNVRWNVQINRAYSKLFKLGKVQCFQDVLDMIFNPLLHHSNNSTNNPEFHYITSNICSIDLVVDESDDYLWKEFSDISQTPKEWVSQGDNPPVAYYMYFIYERLGHFNYVRNKRSEPCITLRCYCSNLENRSSQFSDKYITDQTESLICNLLLCNGGLLNAEYIWSAPALLSYLFYLLQIPVVTAPLSSVTMLSIQLERQGRKYRSELTGISGLCAGEITTRDITVSDDHSYGSNPFMKMFKIGMKTALSSNSVLFNSSYTQEPMIEEFSVAASIYLLNAADLSELARNSVIACGYEGWYKAHWGGVSVKPDKYFKENVGGVDVWYDTAEDTSIKHNVPILRRMYRRDTLDQEWDFLEELFN
ncbi:metallo-dependent hydrolase superfamily protein RNJ42_04685 [Nakaseomyces bracarensis]|uniref:metallo-dependent hydrolase superfamily protein n=1 Tax=Nakaseomyces bracarensis TaxID=273131 RepID=UPI003871757B